MTTTPTDRPAGTVDSKLLEILVCPLTKGWDQQVQAAALRAPSLREAAVLQRPPAAPPAASRQRQARRTRVPVLRALTVLPPQAPGVSQFLARCGRALARASLMRLRSGGRCRRGRDVRLDGFRWSGLHLRRFGYHRLGLGRLRRCRLRLGLFRLRRLRLYRFRFCRFRFGGLGFGRRRRSLRLLPARRRFGFGGFGLRGPQFCRALRATCRLADRPPRFGTA